MRLTDAQIDEIRKRIEKSHITIATLRDDLLDHLCCVVEEMIRRGKDFNQSIEVAVNDLAPDGLDQIQYQTVFLLNSNKIIRMKKFMYIAGLLSTMSFVLGWAFGILRWPGAWELSIYGFLGFAFIYLPLLAIDHFKTGIHKILSERLKIIFGLTSGALIGFSVVMKILHLSGAPTVLIAGTVLLVFGFLPFFFFSLYKKSVS